LSPVHKECTRFPLKVRSKASISSYKEPEKQKEVIFTSKNTVYTESFSVKYSHPEKEGI
jgi:hypothetical protein